MTLDKILQVVDQLSEADRAKLRDHLNQSPHESSQQGIDIAALFQAFDEIRAGLTDEEFAEIEEAMNAEYIEPLDKNE